MLIHMKQLKNQLQREGKKFAYDHRVHLTAEPVSSPLEKLSTPSSFHGEWEIPFFLGLHTGEKNLQAFPSRTAISRGSTRPVGMRVQPM